MPASMLPYSFGSLVFRFSHEPPGNSMEPGATPFTRMVRTARLAVPVRVTGLAPVVRSAPPLVVMANAVFGETAALTWLVTKFRRCPMKARWLANGWPGRTSVWRSTSNA